MGEISILIENIDEEDSNNQEGILDDEYKAKSIDETSGKQYEHFRSSSNLSPADCQNSFEDLKWKNPSQVKESFWSPLVKSVVNTTLFFFMIDLFAIYKLDKCEHQRPRNRFYLMPETMLTKTKIDNLLGLWRIFFNFWLFYIIAKFFIIACIEIFYTDPQSFWISQLEKEYQDTLEGLSILDGTPFSDSWSAMTNYWPSNSSLTIYKVRRFASEFLSNPYSAIPRLSLFITTSIALSLMIGVYLFSEKFRKKPIELCHMRLLIDPKLETKRIDLVLEEKIADILELYKPKTTTEVSSDIDETIDSKSSADQEGDQLLKNVLERFKMTGRSSSKMFRALHKVVLELSHETWLMRPAVYQPEMYRSFCNRALVLFTIGAVFFAIPLCILPFFLYNTAIKARCSMLLGQEEIQCMNRKHFSHFENLLIIEYYLAMSIIVAMIFLHTTMVSVSVYAQMLSVKDVEEDLRDILLKLEAHNSLIDEQFNSILHLNPGQQTKKIMNQKLKESNDRMETNLLRVLIKLSVLSDDCRRNTSFISSVINSLFPILGYCIMLTLTSGKLQSGADMRSIQTTCLFFLLSMSNYVLLACSYHHNCTYKLETIIWSIFAQMFSLSLKEKKFIWNDYIGNAWTKLAYCYLFSDEKNAIYLFNLIVISYKRTISMNFVLLSMAVIMRSW